MPAQAQAPGIGDWFSLETGPFAGRLMCATLEELQKADIGRKDKLTVGVGRYARKDKRPLDPPPVVVMRLFQVAHAGTPHEQVQEFSHLDEPLVFGFTCHVDLFAVAGESSAGPPAGSILGDPGPTHALAFRPPSSMPSPHALPPETANARYPAPTDYLAPSHVQGDTRGQPSDSFEFPRDSLHRSSACDQDAKSQAHGSMPLPFWTLPHNEQCTMLLAGEAFVQCSLVDNDGRQVAMFVFSDLAVRKEGRYRLRYRVFNIFGRYHDQNRPVIPVLAECYGGTFEVFSTKTFPGLQVSTDLTKKISLSGVRVNSRHRERQGWKKARRSTSSDERSPQRTTTSMQSPPVGRASGSGQKPGPWLPPLPGSAGPLGHSSPSPSPQAEFTFTHPHRMPGPSALFSVTPMAALEPARGAVGNPWAKSGVADADVAMGDETQLHRAGTGMGDGNRSGRLHHP
ncbi:velvet factor-domain-containing protein [Earliella scabrosa]|nr:velvet factor-domain-containing protein [Earliella scabrosa]